MKGLSSVPALPWTTKAGKSDRTGLGTPLKLIGLGQEMHKTLACAYK
jgi:hypothetical protein